MNVFGRQLPPHGLVVDLVPLDVNVGVAGVPAARWQIRVAFHRHRDAAGVVLSNLEAAAGHTVFGSPREH